MSIAIGQSAATNSAHTRSHPTNFGALVSAIHRGDIAAAANAYTALNELAPDRPGWSRKGKLEAIGDAIKARDLQAAKTALKDFQQFRLSKGREEESTAVLEPTLAFGGSVSILL